MQVRIIDTEIKKMLTSDLGTVVAEQNNINPRTAQMEKQHKVVLREVVIRPSSSCNISAIWLFSDQFQDDE